MASDVQRESPVDVVGRRRAPTLRDVRLSILERDVAALVARVDRTLADLDDRLRRLEAAR